MAPNEPRSGRGWVLKCPGPSGLLLALLAALLLARCAAAARPAPDRPGVSGGGAKRAACIGGGQQVAGVLADARALRADIFKFWLDHGPDTTYGGVHAVRLITGAGKGLAARRVTAARSRSADSRAHGFKPALGCN